MSQCVKTVVSQCVKTLVSQCVKTLVSQTHSVSQCVKTLVSQTHSVSQCVKTLVSQTHSHHCTSIGSFISCVYILVPGGHSTNYHRQTSSTVAGVSTSYSHVVLLEAASPNVLQLLA